MGLIKQNIPDLPRAKLVLLFGSEPVYRPANRPKTVEALPADYRAPAPFSLQFNGAV